MASGPSAIPAVNDWQPVDPGDWAPVGTGNAEDKPKGKTIAGFLGNVITSAVNTGEGMYNAARHPINTAIGLGTAAIGASPVQGPPGSFQHDVAAPVAQRVGQFYKDRYGSIPAIENTAYTDPVGMAADVSAVAAPVEGAARGVGALADAAGASGVADAARATADVAGSVKTYGNPVSAAGAGIGAGFRKIAGMNSALTNLSPAEQAAVDYALKDPKLRPSVDAATASGNQFLKSTKALIEKSPASAGIAGDAGQTQQAAITGKMADVADAVAPGGARTPLTAGTSAWKHINGKISDYNKTSKTAFQKLFTIADQNAQDMQVGMKPNPSLDPSAPDQIPVTARVAGPVSTAQVKATAQPMLDELTQSIGTVAAQASPAAALLRQIIARPDVVDLETAINDNSAIQNIARTETPQLRTQAQRISAALVPAYRGAIDTAAQALGPDAAAALDEGRAATVQKYDLANSLPRGSMKAQNPVRLSKFLTAGDDISVPALQSIAKHVPDALPDIARSTLEDIFSNATENGGITKIDSTINKWNKLGDATKQILFGPGTTDEVDNLLKYAKMTTANANPSGSATVGHVAGLAALLLRDPMTAIAAMAGSRAIARGIFNPENAEAIRATGSVPLPQASVGARAAGRAATAPLNPTYLNMGRVINNGLGQ